MEWPRYPLGEVAPACPADIEFPPTKVVWQLGLEHIESHTGAVASKVRAPAGEAGNSTFAFDEGNVLYSKLRPYLNKVVVPDEPGIATSELIPLRPRPNLILREYLAYYLRSPAFVSFASQFVTGAKMPRVILDKFWAHPVPLPPPSEQRRIVEILAQADRLRRLRAEAGAKADRILPALFIKMFGDPTTNPMGWPTAPLGTLFAQDKAAVDGVTGKDLPYLGLEHIESGTGRILISQAEARKVKVRGLAYRFGPQHVLYGKLRPYLNKVALPSFEGRCSTELVPLLPSRSVPREFIAAYLRLPYIVNAAIAKNRGARMPRADMRLLMQMKVPIPPTQAQKDFASKYLKVEDISRRLNNVKSCLDVLFSVLLNQAFTGSLTASWREARMRELLQEMEEQAAVLAEVEI